MYPMFKQIKADEIALILQDFDLKTLSEDEIRFNLEVLNLKIASLFNLIQQENNLV